MKILVVGKGGPEHALVRALAESPVKPEVFCFPGSDSIFEIAKPVVADGLESLIEWMKPNAIDLCVAGEESYLVKGQELAAGKGVAVCPDETGITQGDPSKLFAALEASPELGQIEFQITSKKWRKIKKKKVAAVAAPRSGRTVVQTVRAMKITPRPPDRPGGAKITPTSFWAVLAEEIDPPEGEEPVRWLLLTSKPVETFKEACRMIKLYLRRWDIEVFHRVLKTGCRVEQIQLKTAEALIKALVIYSIIAWRILYLTHLGRHSPELPCGKLFSEGEWKATCLIVKRPATAGEPTIGEFIKIVGKLGGHLGRKSDGPPGPQSIWRGMERVRNFGQAWYVMHGDG